MLVVYKRNAFDRASGTSGALSVRCGDKQVCGSVEYRNVRNALAGQPRTSAATA